MHLLSSVRLRHLFAALVIVFLLVAASLYLFSRMYRLDDYKEQILVELQSALNRKITYDTGRLEFRPGPSFAFSKVSIYERDGKKLFLTAENLTFKVGLFPLLRKRLVMKEVHLNQPEIALHRDSNGAMNIDDLVKEGGREDDFLFHIHGIRIRKGTVRLTDLATGELPVQMALQNLDITLSHLARGRKCSFKITGRVKDTIPEASFSLSGKAGIADRDKPISDTLVNATVVTKNLDVGPFWPYYSRYVPFRKIEGRFDINSKVKGKLRDFESNGNIGVRGLRFDYPQVFHAVLTPKSLTLAYGLHVTQDTIEVKSLDLNVDGARVTGKCALQEIRSGDLRIVANASTSQMRFEDFHGYIPYGIIVKDTADFIEQKIRGGLFTLEEGRLDGRISQIAHMERDRNYNVLSIRGRVEKGLLKYGESIPPFHEIKGGLDLQGKDFILRSMTGQFGSSPFSLEGRITDYPLDHPSGYPFDMVMNPKQPELAWLVGADHAKQLAFSGEGKLHLKGDGTTAFYTLSGNSDLSGAAYGYGTLLQKPSGRPNSITFQSSITRTEAKLSQLQYVYGPMSLGLTGSYIFTGKEGLSLEVASSRFQINEIAHLFPALSGYAPSGGIQLNLKGTSRSGSSRDLEWHGPVSLWGASIKIFKNIEPLKEITGTLLFTGSGLESSRISGRFGSSIIHGKGTAKGFRNPSIDLNFSIPSLNPVDIGFGTGGKDLQISKVEADLSLHDGRLDLQKVSGRIGSTWLTVKGAIPEIDSPSAELDITSPFLHLDDIAVLTALEKKHPEAGRSMAIKASLHAETGQAGQLRFEDLGMNIQAEGRICYLQKIALKTLEGEIRGDGRIDSGTPDSPPRYQMNCDVQKISVEHLLRALGVQKREMTGLLSAQANITARGHTLDELKRSALGSVRFECQRGHLRKFPVLAKVFSILNLSQLLKFRLPDMVSGGMPFNRISGSLAIRDGIASSEDFLISSEAMNISALGKIDLVREEIQATIGVQPLQTVDKVVNRIPVVGWILTGEKKAFLTTYFEAHGRLDDPTVKAIPVKSMTKGVLNIFTRIFQLPGKLITDTGEVLLGK